MTKQKSIERVKEARMKWGEAKNHSGAMEKVVSNLAHELGNPLDGVRRYIGLALQESIGDSISREYLLKANDGVFQIMRILHDLLAYSKQCGQQKGKIVEIHSLLDWSLSGLIGDDNFQGIQIRKKFCDDSIYIEDRGLIITLHNLYRNAAQAMNGQGTLTIKTWAQNGSACVSVEDTGNGVSEAIKERIFEPYFSTKKQNRGTGIGLTLAREIAEQCGGELRYENSEDLNSGARFVLLVPRTHLKPNT